MASPETYTVKRVADMQRAFGGAVVRVRAELGITAFGVQVVDLPASSGELAPEPSTTTITTARRSSTCSSRARPR
jgi:hypothetical protein